jgi:hypothetical protein
MAVRRLLVTAKMMAAICCGAKKHDHSRNFLVDEDLILFLRSDLICGYFLAMTAFRSQGFELALLVRVLSIIVFSDYPKVYPTSVVSAK